MQHSAIAWIEVLNTRVAPRFGRFWVSISAESLPYDVHVGPARAFLGEAEKTP